MDDFVVAVNPEEGSSLPYLLRLPLPGGAVVLKAREMWPRTAKVYCHPAEWPAEPEVLERVPVRSCRRRGAAIDLVLDRGRENRSQFVFARARGRQMIFWQTQRVARKARPNVSLPTAASSGGVLEILVDTGERYPWAFSAQQAATLRRHLPVGDYAVEVDGVLVGIVERKSAADLVGGLMNGRVRAQLAELATAPRAALVVEDSYAAVLKQPHVRKGAVLDALAEVQVRVPEVPIVFAQTRPLAQEWAYRFLGACMTHHHESMGADRLTAQLPAAGPLPPSEPTAAEVREWAKANDVAIGDAGRIPVAVRAAYDRAHDH